MIGSSIADAMPPPPDASDNVAPPQVTTGAEHDQTANNNTNLSAGAADSAPAVRFSSAVDVAPNPPVVTASNDNDDDNTFNDVAADELRAFTKSLHGKPLQTKRMNTSYQFEAFSLPASRVRCMELNHGTRRN